MVFSQELLDATLDNSKLRKEVAEKYLNLYVGHSESWWDAVVRLHGIVQKRNPQDSKEEIADKLKNQVAFTILFPTHDRNAKVDRENPENNLFWGLSYDQINGRDWFKELQDVVREDVKITEYRNRVLDLGIIDALDFHPPSRQAFRWICDELEGSGLKLTPDREKKFRNFVKAYGGALISYVFEKHKEKINRNVINWYGAYFLEKQIYDIYSLEQVLKIKENDIKNTNPDWVKQVR